MGAGGEGVEGREVEDRVGCAGLISIKVRCGGISYIVSGMYLAPLSGLQKETRNDP